jgi:A1 cistron-splicing factor AAR2
MTDPFRLLGELQLAFIILLHLSSYSALTVYKRFLPLFTRSSSLLSSPTDYLTSSVDVAKLYSGLVSTLAAQLQALPAGVFETELPEFDLFFLDEIESLRYNLASVPWSSQLMGPWQVLHNVGQTWKWNISDLQAQVPLAEEEESDEEGEYAPVVVEM